MKDIIDEMTDNLDKMTNAAASYLFGSKDEHHSIEVIRMTRIEVSETDAPEGPAKSGASDQTEGKDGMLPGGSAQTANSSPIRLTSAAGQTFETRIGFKIDRNVYKTIQSEYQYLQTEPGSYQFELVRDENSETGWSLRTSPKADLKTLLNDSVCEVGSLYPLSSGDIIKIGSGKTTAAPLTVSIDDAAAKKPDGIGSGIEENGTPAPQAHPDTSAKTEDEKSPAKAPEEPAAKPEAPAKQEPGSARETDPAKTEEPVKAGEAVEPEEPAKPEGTDGAVLPLPAEETADAEKPADAEAPAKEDQDKAGESAAKPEADVEDEATDKAGEPAAKPEADVEDEAPDKAGEPAAKPEADVEDEATDKVCPPAEEKPWNCSSEETWPKSAILARSKQAEKTVKEWIAAHGSQFGQLEFAFNFAAGGNRVHVVCDRCEIPEELWFIGDLHGDILALDAALSYIDSHSISPTIVFLGDLFDRFDYGIEVVMRVISLIIERPGKILWIAGNHDDGLFFKDGKFSSKVHPAEFVDFLDQHAEYQEIGQWLIEFCQQLPRAVFLPDGLFIAHGGCLGFDMNDFSYAVDSVKTLDDLEKEENLKTFIWNRIIPDQAGKSGNEVGKDDLVYFMAAVGKLTGFPVKRMLRGHDHCKESRHEFFDFYYPEAPVLTLTTMSAWYLGSENSNAELLRAMRKEPVTTPAIAKFRFDELPEVVTLDIPRSVVEQFHVIEDLEPHGK